MNVQDDRDRWIGAANSIPDSIERAIAERTRAGYADEARYGFPARLANATPPVNEAFQRALRARILTGLPESTRAARRPLTTRNRVQTVNIWRFSLAGGLAAMLILTLAFAISRYVRLRDPEVSSAVSPIAPAPRIASRDVDALAERINGELAFRTVVIFPGHYAETLAGHIRHEVVPLTLNDTLGVPAIRAVLGGVLPASGFVDVIMVNPQATEAEHSVRIALEQQLYRLYRPGEKATEAFGTLERSQFVVGPEYAAMEPIGATFSNGVELVASGTLDDPQPGEPLRLVFDWRAMEPVSDSTVVYAHLICDGRLVAQRDEMPGNGLFPVDGWESGELVRDQFALLLPPELPACAYEIQVGIYDPTSGQRYSVTGPEGGAYVVVERYSLKD